MAVSQPSPPGRRSTDDAFWASVPGQAVRAFDSGDQFFSYEEPYLRATPAAPGLPPAGTRGRSRTCVLAQIEAAGWRLQHANWVNEPDGSVIGIYLFRRDDTRSDRVTGPAPRPAQQVRPVLRLHTD
jgi:hypothetical protein